MSYRNISQSTYDRLMKNLEKNCGFTVTDCRDLLRAYEDSVELLDEMIDAAGMEVTQTLNDEVTEFLYLENGDPRVVLDGA